MKKNTNKMSEKKVLTAIIEKASDGGYGIYVPDIEFLFGYGLTEQEAKQDLMETLEERLEDYKDRQIEIPVELNSGNIGFKYHYDFSGFFQSFPFFNVSALAKEAGLNSSLLRKYKEGLAIASPAQKKRLEGVIHGIAERLRIAAF
ncbi:MAG: type II toxin-antitoxin system HicB family antitoxin [Prevotellaceae bacterium]|nr:type II toxin-antitoxin system HicB family antitoxin [Prevotellaceae bacterium]